MLAAGPNTNRGGPQAHVKDGMNMSLEAGNTADALAPTGMAGECLPGQSMAAGGAKISACFCIKLHLVRGMRLWH